MTWANGFIKDLRRRGRAHFTTAEAAEKMGRSQPATQAVLRRLKAKGEIATPYRGFHVIVPPEYDRLGCLPAEHFVPQLAQHLGEPYYVALLSAAAYHGAAHQKPHRFQVMVSRYLRPLACGEVHVQFISKRDMAATPVVQRNTPQGVIRLASAAATAYELVGYADQAGGLNHVATVLAELAESLQPTDLMEEARRVPLAWAQRLGYLLTVVDASRLASSIEPIIYKRNPSPVVLAPSAAAIRHPYDARWRVVINIQVESDL